MLWLLWREILYFVIVHKIGAGGGGGEQVIVSLKVNFKGSRAMDYIAIGMELSMVNIYNKYSHYRSQSL